MPNSQHPIPITSFITFEGGEGTGKSTQVKLLSQAFQKAGINVTITREPGGTEGAESIRNLLVNGDVAKWEATTELLLHLAARTEHVSKFIKPALASGSCVVCDRFTDSTMAYQAYGHGLGINYVQQLSNLSLGNFQPDLTIMLDMDVKASMERAKGRGNKENRYERMGTAFHDNVRRGFLEIASTNPQRCVVINADSDIDTIHRKIVEAVNARLGTQLGNR